MQIAYLIGSIALFIIWLFIFLKLKSKDSKAEMIKVSLATSLLGLTEPLFVPEYWNPPTLFDLAQRTGFDLESFIFSFAIGGIVSVIYESVFPSAHEEMTHSEKSLRRHRFHTFVVISPPLLFILLALSNALNPIYAAILALFYGFFAAWYCRPDLKGKMAVSGLIFLSIYFVYFQILIFLYPGYVEAVWNFSDISGRMIFGIPLEELLFALSFGFFWSSVYEHIK